jgi:CBS domain-containing protein
MTVTGGAKMSRRDYAVENRAGGRNMVARAADIMSRQVVAVAPHDTVHEAAKILSRNKISAAPVCGSDGKLLGMISEGDLMAPFRESRRLGRDWWLGILAGGGELTESFWNALRQDVRSVADLMTRHVYTATEDATLPRLAEMMISHGVKRIPIVRDGIPIGIVSRADIVAELARSPAMLV